MDIFNTKYRLIKLIFILYCFKIETFYANPLDLAIEEGIHWSLGDEGGIWSFNCDFPNNEDLIESFKSKKSECGQKCMNTHDCSHYTWTSERGGTCLLRNGEVTRENALLSKENSIVCGIMPYKRPTSHVSKVTDSSQMNKILPSFEEFTNAFTLNDYPSPSLEKYQNFIQSALTLSEITSKTELAMFLTHILQESGGLKFKIEKRCGNHCTSTKACLNDYKTNQDIPGKHYCGRGYIQLSWAYNYKSCSEYIFGDDRLLFNPDQVAMDDKLAWATAFWYWKENVRINQDVLDFKFGASTMLINGDLECKGDATDIAKMRFEKYVNVLKAFHIKDEPVEEGCYN